MPGITEDMLYFTLGDISSTYMPSGTFPRQAAQQTTDGLQRLHPVGIEDSRECMWHLGQPVQCLHTPLAKKLKEDRVGLCDNSLGSTSLVYTAWCWIKKEIREVSTFGTWRATFNWEDVDQVRGGDIDQRQAEEQQLTLEKYFNAEARLVQSLGSNVSSNVET